MHDAYAFKYVQYIEGCTWICTSERTTRTYTHLIITLKLTALQTSMSMLLLRYSRTLSRLPALAARKKPVPPSV